MLNPYRLADHIRWTADIHAVKLLDTKKQGIRTIHYPEAALWDLIQQGFPLSRIDEMMSSIMKSDIPAAEKWTSEKISEWLAEGIFCKKDG